MNSHLQVFLNGIEPSKASGKCTVVALTSANPKEGVSYVSQSFAVELAERTGQRTLIADAMGLQRVDMIHLNHVSRFCSSTDVPNLYVFSADDPEKVGEATQQLVLKKRRSRSVLANGLDNLQTLRFVFDYVFLDCGSLSRSDVAALLAPSVEGVVLVVEAERTRKEQVRKAMDTIETANGNLLGCVLNKRRYAVPNWIYSKI